MAEAVLVGDTAGGAIGSVGSGILVNGVELTGAGAMVAPHPPCPMVQIHCMASMSASSGVTVNGTEICVAGDSASCGHSASASSGVDIS